MSFKISWTQKGESLKEMEEITKKKYENKGWP